MNMKPFLRHDHEMIPCVIHDHETMCKHDIKPIYVDIFSAVLFIFIFKIKRRLKTAVKMLNEIRHIEKHPERFFLVEHFLLPILKTVHMTTCRF